MIDYSTMYPVYVISPVDPEIRANPFHDNLGKFSNKTGGKVSKFADVTEALKSGKKATIDPSKVDGLMGELANGPVLNLASLQISGKGNENMFQVNARDIARRDMPQLSARRGEWKAFSDQLGKRDIQGIEEHVDPRELKATQNELDSVKVASMYRDVKRGTIDPTKGLLFVSEDGAILDGHHRWAGFAAAAASGDDVKVPVLRVSADIDEMLEIARLVSGPGKELDE